MPSRVLRIALAGAALIFACVAYTWAMLPDTRALRAQNPPVTAFMRMRADEARDAGKTARVLWRWVPYRRISPSLVRAVLVSEDARFWEHDGVDLEELKIAMEDSLTHGTSMRGASTITQQLAKNLYLSPTRNPYRKLTELFITRRLEAELPKRRILEIYLNVVEWGDDVWGADAAARVYFGVGALDLSREQAALLAASLINPRVYSPGHPNARLLRRQQTVLARMGDVTPPAPAPE